MATVKISESLVTTIRHNINGLFNKRINALFDPMPVSAQDMYQLVFEEHIPIINNVPSAYLSQVEYFDLTFTINDLRKDFRFRSSTKAGFKIPANYKQAQPAEFGLLKLEQYTTCFSGPVDNTTPRFASVINTLTPIFAEAQRLTTERNTTEATIKKLLCSVGTLQQVHKVYPMILELCPADTVAKFHQKVERTSKVNEAKRELDAVDLSALTGAVVANKLGGGE